MARKTKNENLTKLTPSKQRKGFAAFANQLDQGVLPTEEQLEWLQKTFLALSNPDRDPMRVLGLNYTAGHSARKEIAAQRIDFLMHWIAGATSKDTAPYKDPKDSPAPLTPTEAISEAAKIAKRLFSQDPNSSQYSEEYIRKCWYDGEKHYRQSPYRDDFYPGSYYKFPVTSST